MKIRFYQNKVHPSGETRLDIFEAYSMVKPENHFKSDTNCFYEDGTPSKLAVAFCEIHGEKDCSSQMVEVEQK